MRRSRAVFFNEGVDLYRDGMTDIDEARRYASDHAMTEQQTEWLIWGWWSAWEEERDAS
jgi:hypothetical protein